LSSKSHVHRGGHPIDWGSRFANHLLWFLMSRLHLWRAFLYAVQIGHHSWNRKFFYTEIFNLRCYLRGNFVFNMGLYNKNIFQSDRVVNCNSNNFEYTAVSHSFRTLLSISYSRVISSIGFISQHYLCQWNQDTS